jgi:uncharacterized sporulation protein YeaH/YhbH (DUF444 family)
LDDYFRTQFEELKKAAQHLMQASTEVHAAGQSVVKVTEAALHAMGEHEDLRETIHRLEALVEDLLRRQNGS